MSQRAQELLIRLGESVGNNVAQSGQKNFEQDALKYFSEKPLNSQSIQEFSSMYPGIPVQDVFKYAAGVGQIKERQIINDVGLNTLNAKYSGVFKTPKGKDDFIRSQMALYKGYPDAVLKGVKGGTELNNSLPEEKRIELSRNTSLLKQNYDTGEWETEISAAAEPVKVSRINPKTKNAESYETRSSEELLSYLNAKDELGNSAGWQKGEIKEGKTPTIPMYHPFAMGDNTFQDMQYNPLTGKNDIPVGKPYKKREGADAFTADAKQERFLQSIDNNAKSRAGKEIALKYGSTNSPILVVGNEVQFNPSGGNPEALNEYNQLFNKYRNEAIKRTGMSKYVGDETPTEASPNPVAAASTPTSNFVDSGRTSGGKKVFIPKGADINNPNTPVILK